MEGQKPPRSSPSFLSTAAAFAVESNDLRSLLWRSHLERQRDALATVADHTLQRKAKLFFWEYDNNTHPGLVARRDDLPADERQKRIAIISSMAPKLAARVRARGIDNIVDRSVLATNTNDISNGDVQFVSDIQTTVFNQHWSDSKGEGSDGDGFDFVSLDRAFELFSNGSLRVNAGGMWNGEPDSAYELSFAEFAFLAIERGVDIDFWTGVLAGMVKSQEIWQRVYEPPGGRPSSYGAYRNTNFKADRQYRETELEALRVSCAGRDLTWLNSRATTNAASAFNRA